MTTATETRAAPLNSGTFGVEVDEAELVGLAVEGVPEETGGFCDTPLLTLTLKDDLDMEQTECFLPKEHPTSSPRAR